MQSLKLGHVNELNKKLFMKRFFYNHIKSCTIKFLKNNVISFNIKNYFYGNYFK
jgi:hypothetical protein